MLSRRGIISQSILLAAGFSILAAMAGASVWLAQRSADDAHWVQHSLDVENELSLLQLSVRRAESGQRGYLLTSDQDFQETYRQSLDAIDRYSRRLRELVADNPDQGGRVSMLGQLLNEKLTELKRVDDLTASGDRNGAIAIIGNDASQQLMARFADVATDIRTSEQSLLADRTARGRETNGWLLATTLVGAVVLVILAVLALVLIRRSSAGLLRAQRQLSEANANLEAKVAERTSDLSEANDELQRFAYIVSHDLRSPLVNIMGFTGELEALRKDLMERDGATTSAESQQIYDDFDEALGFIKASIAKMDRLIKAILDLSRAGRRDFAPQMIDLNAVLGNIQRAVAHQAQEAGATITIGQLPELESDRLAVDQIFSNLVDNAVKYLLPGRPGHIEVTGLERSGFVVIRVADNGRGIDPADRERVFELFRRAGMQDRPGEGIGLAHVRALVRRIGGRIRLDSAPGEGSTFTVFLPKHWREDERPALRPSDVGAQDGPQPHNDHALVAE